METRELNDWNTFASAIASIQTEYGSHRVEGTLFPNEILYRGQADASWPLQTTLERFDDREWSITSYMEVIHACLPRLESYTNRSWGIPEWPAVERSIQENFKVGRVLIPHYDYWVYLRHHGFPSPLLDWTASPYIAAFFAFENAVAKRVAIYAYIEKTKGHKGTFVANSRLTVQGPYVNADHRHFLQQAQYTVAHRARGNDHQFVPHESVFENPERGQDILIKLTLPISERRAALNALRVYNMNRFSLFQSTEALLRTLAYEEIEGRRE